MEEKAKISSVPLLFSSVTGILHLLIFKATLKHEWIVNSLYSDGRRSPYSNDLTGGVSVANIQVLSDGP